MSSAATIREIVDAIYRTESRRVLATLIRLLGEFDLAEEALHDATGIAKKFPGARKRTVEKRPIFKLQVLPQA